MTELRDQLRAKVFSGENKPKARVIEFFGAQIELRQPTLSQIITANASEDRESAVIDMLVNRAFVPGTDENMFEDTDADALKALPFDSNFVRVSSAFEEMTDVNFRKGEDVSKTDTAETVDDEASLGAKAD